MRQEVLWDKVGLWDKRYYGTCFRPFQGISVFARVATGNVKNYTPKRLLKKTDTSPTHIFFEFSTTFFP